MPRAGSASLLCIAVAAVACGAGRRDRAVVFDTARPVIALDVRDGVFAWASSSPVYNAHCGTRFWRWIPGRRAEALPVPAKYATACLDSPGPVGGVDLSPTAVGWTIDDEGGNTGEILYGASMAGARHSVAFAHEFTNGGPNGQASSSQVSPPRVEASSWATRRPASRARARRGRMRPQPRGERVREPRRERRCPSLARQPLPVIAPSACRGARRARLVPRGAHVAAERTLDPGAASTTGGS